jgi:Bacterial mobilisation protein (MobC).
LQALARAAGRPRTEVLRQLIAAGRVRERLRRERLDVMFQLKGMARNLNQLTRLAHAKGFTGTGCILRRAKNRYAGNDCENPTRRSTKYTTQSKRVYRIAVIGTI